MKKTLWSVVIACALGCTGTGGGSQPLSVAEQPDEEQQRCEFVCSPYDPADCREVCPPPPPDAAIPEDPYSGSGEPTPEGRPVDAGVPGDPYAIGPSTDEFSRAGHRPC